MLRESGSEAAARALGRHGFPASLRRSALEGEIDDHGKRVVGPTELESVTSTVSR